MRVKRFSVCLLAVMLMHGAWELSAHAGNYAFSDSDKAVFAFYHYAKGEPDFEKWVKNSPPYLSAPLETKEEIFEQEMLRLKWGYGTLDLEHEDLNIKTDIMFQVRRVNDAEFLSFKFVNSGKEDVPYFSYPYGQEWIAVVVNDLGNFTTVPLTADEAAHVHEFVPDDQVHAGTVNIRIRPVSVDREAPLKLDDTEQWLMLGKVSGIEFFALGPGGQQISLWKYVEKTLLTETEKALMPLLQ